MSHAPATTAGPAKVAKKRKLHGIMATFADPAAISHAAAKVRDAGFKKWDVFSPFPVHGMEESMGLPFSKLPLLVGAIGLSGAAIGFLFQYWVCTSGYMTNVQGKPYEAWQPLVPVTFEIGVLFSAFASLIGMLAFNGLPRWHHPLMCKEKFLKASDDAFIICIESKDKKWDENACRELLTRAGATSVELVEE